MYTPLSCADKETAAWVKTANPPSREAMADGAGGHPPSPEATDAIKSCSPYIGEAGDENAFGGKMLSGNDLERKCHWESAARWRRKGGKS
jgi:hypothetical protein